MPEGRSSLVVRILRFVLIVFGPLLLSLLAVTVFSPLPEATRKTLLLVSWAWMFSFLILTPALLSSGSESSSDPSDPDGGGGNEPPQPPSPPGAPRGGIPLPDARQARERVRDHDRPDRVRPRRRGREPEPAPVSAPADA